LVEPEGNKEVAMLGKSDLSEAAVALFRLRLDRHGDVRVDDTTRTVYRELAHAGLMIAVSTYAGGPESAYRLTSGLLPIQTLARKMIAA
jgi:hypothetical protein